MKNKEDMNNSLLRNLAAARKQRADKREIPVDKGEDPVDKRDNLVDKGKDPVDKGNDIKEDLENIRDTLRDKVDKAAKAPSILGRLNRERQEREKAQKKISEKTLGETLKEEKKNSSEVLEEFIAKGISDVLDPVTGSFLLLETLVQDFAKEADANRYARVWSVLREILVLLKKIHGMYLDYNQIIRDLVQTTKKSSDVLELRKRLNLSPEEIKTKSKEYLDLLKGYSEAILRANFSDPQVKRVLEALNEVFQKGQEYFGYQAPDLVIDMDTSKDEEIAKKLQETDYGFPNLPSRRDSPSRRPRKINDFDVDYGFPDLPSRRDSPPRRPRKVNDFEVDYPLDDLPSRRDSPPPKVFPVIQKKKPRVLPKVFQEKLSEEEEEEIKRREKFKETSKEVLLYYNLQDLFKIAKRIYLKKDLDFSPPHTREALVNYIIAETNPDTLSDYMYGYKDELIYNEIPIVDFS